LVFSESPELEDIGYLEYARRKGVAGAIFFGLLSSDPQFAGLAASAFPWVSIDCPVPGARRGFVGTDNAQAMTLLLESAWNEGHRDFGYLAMRGGGWVATTRRRAFEDFLATKGQDHASRVSECRLSADAGEAAALDMLDRADRPRFLCCATDLHALGALRAARVLGLRIPEDLAVSGFDDIAAAAHAHPPLSTVAQDVDGIGRAAIGALFDEQPNPASILLPAHLVRRNSW
jgi:DNA-binding LacI/PurR family transcriptional regulator